MPQTSDAAGATTALPRWDVSAIFPDLGSREFAAAHEAFGAAVTRLRGLYDERGIRRIPSREPGPEDLAALDDVLAATNEVMTDARLLSAYVESFVTTDATDDRAARLRSLLQADTAGLESLTARFEGWVASLGAEDLIAAHAGAADHAYPLLRAEASAGHRMDEGQEDLYADLSLTGSKAWGRLHGDVTARLKATIALADGTVETVPVTLARAMATGPDPARREAAYRGELAAWEQAAVPLAAALNAIKGEANAVNRRRGWDDALSPALFANGVDRTTLDAMHEAARASFPDFRRYLRAKAALLGHPGGLPWWDLFAPVAPTGGDLDWGTAASSVRDVFASFSPSLRRLADRAFSEAWIDAEPRDGKVGGAFCMSVRDDESRVLLNFDGSWDGVQTLAHELGHAYHNTTLAHRTPLQRQTPMALAETASIFCETLMTAAGLRTADPGRRLALLDTDLSGACQVVVDIHSRFLFEQAVCAERSRGVLGAPDLCRLMTDAQSSTYGDGLDPATYHPYMWAVKPHYYGRAFYNWPYMFGLLFGIGLFARFEADPDAFRGGYDDLLSSTGLADAAGLAQRFGIDIRTVDFWAESLDVLRGRINEFVELASGSAGD